MKRILVCLLSLFLLTGCAGEQAAVEPQAVSLVLGHHANAPQPGQGLYEQLIFDAMYSYGQVSAVISDGEPALACHYENQAPGKPIDDAKRRQLAQNNTQTVLTQLAGTWASEPEIDTLEAVHTAANALRGSGLAAQTLVIVDSGLSTAGILDFTASNLLDAEPSAVVEALRQRQSIPDLQGMDVLILGLGQTAGAQPRPDSEALAKLTALWEAILQAGEPKSLTIDPTPLADQASDRELPSVTTVSLVTEALDLTAPVQEEPIRLSSIQFCSDLSEFLDREAAVEALTPVAEWLAENRNQVVCLAGMTASVGGDGVALSLERAEACKAVLVELGAREEQVRCLGLGRSENFLRVADLDAEGNLIESEAEKNRAVFLFSADSETAERLIVQ